jgi:hypothetical protein
VSKNAPERGGLTRQPPQAVGGRLDLVADEFRSDDRDVSARAARRQRELLH